MGCNASPGGVRLIEISISIKEQIEFENSFTINFIHLRTVIIKTIGSLGKLTIRSIFYLEIYFNYYRIIFR